MRIEVRYQGDFPTRGLMTLNDVLRETGVEFKSIHITTEAYLVQISNLYKTAKESNIGQGKNTDSPSSTHVGMCIISIWLSKGTDILSNLLKNNDQAQINT